MTETRRVSWHNHPARAHVASAFHIRVRGKENNESGGGGGGGGVARP